MSPESTSAVELAIIDSAGAAYAADAIDPAVGLSELAPIGAKVGPDAPLARVHAPARPSGSLRRATTRRLSHREARPAPADPGMSELATRARHSSFAVWGWEPTAWRKQLKALLPSHPVATLGEPFDRASNPLRAPWRSARRALGPSNLQAIFSLGAGVDHLFADAALPDAPIVRVVDPDLRDRISEWVVMHALVHLRQLRRYERQQQGRVWATRWSAEGRRGSGRRAGSRRHRHARGNEANTMGFKVAGWSATPKSVAGIGCFSGADGLQGAAGENRYPRRPLPLTSQRAGF